MPENIRKGRNVAIILAFVEFGCCLLSFGFYDIERSKALLVVLLLTFVTTIGGLYAKVRLSYSGLLLHSFYNIPVVGGFYIYILIAWFFTSDSKHDGALSDTITLLISSIPMFAIFIMGIYSCVLAIKVEEELEARAKVNKASNSGRAEGRSEAPRPGRGAGYQPV